VVEEIAVVSSEEPVEIAVEAIVVEEAAEIVAVVLAEEPVSAWREDPVGALFDAIYRLVGEHVVGPLGDLARRFYNVSK
jgi:hypothetical protein